MQQLGAGDGLASVAEQMPGRGRLHAQHRSAEIDPQVMPQRRRRCGGKRTGGIHAHAGQRRLKCDVQGNHGARAQPGEPGKVRGIRHAQHHQHQQAGDHELPDEGTGSPQGTRHGCGVVHRGRRKGIPQQGCRAHHAQPPTDELREDIEGGIPARDLPQSQERQRHRRVHVGAGALAPRGIDQHDRGQSHGDADAGAAGILALEEPAPGGGRVAQQRGKHARRDHEHAQRPALDQVLGPMLAQ